MRNIQDVFDYLAIAALIVALCIVAHKLHVMGF